MKRDVLDQAAKEMGIKMYYMMDDDVLLTNIQYYAEEGCSPTVKKFSNEVWVLFNRMGITPKINKQKEEDEDMENSKNGTAKKAKVKKAEAAGKEIVKVTTFGHRVGSQCGFIDEKLEAGETREALTKSLMAKYHWTKAKTASKLKGYFAHLETKNLHVAENEETGKFHVTHKHKTTEPQA